METSHVTANSSGHFRASDAPQPLRTRAHEASRPHATEEQLMAAPRVVDRTERRARLAIRHQPSASLALTGLVAAVLRAGLASIPGTAPSVSFVASSALGDAEDVLIASW